jgi:3'-phosphoadenosine 5'-phosphosulfate (PAPS) 3'-phosphatase
MENNQLNKILTTILRNRINILNESTANTMLGTFANAKSIQHATKIKNMFINTANKQLKKITSIISKNANKSETSKILKNLNTKHQKAIQSIENKYQKIIKQLER